MKFAFIMDPLHGVKAWKDTSYYLMLAARQRGHQVYHLDQNDLQLRDSQVIAEVCEVDVHDDIDHPFSPADRMSTEMSTMDVVMVRTDPPFDRRYFYATLLLDLLPVTTRVINRPSGLRNWNEKLAATFFPDFTPATLVSRSIRQIHEFMQQRGRLTLKPIDGHGGGGIEFVAPGDAAADMLIARATVDESRWIIAQEYLPAASNGDKRILILDGEPLGAILRLAAEGMELNNLDAGGTANPATLFERDLEICAAIKSGLIEQGIRFCGIDVIGGQLIEINVTSPTGLQEMCRFDNKDYHHRIIAALER